MSDSPRFQPQARNRNGGQLYDTDYYQNAEEHRHRDPKWGGETLAAALQATQPWNHRHWTVEIVDSHTGKIVARSNADGTWDEYPVDADEEAGGEGPRDDEPFDQYLARLRERDAADL